MTSEREAVVYVLVAILQVPTKLSWFTTRVTIGVVGMVDVELDGIKMDSTPAGWCDWPGIAVLKWAENA